MPQEKENLQKMDIANGGGTPPLLLISFFSQSFIVHFVFEVKYTFSCDFYA